MRTTLAALILLFSVGQMASASLETSTTAAKQTRAEQQYAMLLSLGAGCGQQHAMCVESAFNFGTPEEKVATAQQCNAAYKQCMQGN